MNKIQYSSVLHGKQSDQEKQSTACVLSDCSNKVSIHRIQELAKELIGSCQHDLEDQQVIISSAIKTHNQLTKLVSALLVEQLKKQPSIEFNFTLGDIVRITQQFIE